jgi:single-strand DNA-binding protein
MARSLNQVTLMELRQTPNGQSVCSFSLALNRSYKGSDGEWQEATDYIDVVAWAGLGERVSQYLNKGRRCLVQGRLQSRSWEQDGQKRSKVEVLATDVTFLDGRQGGGDGFEDSSSNRESSSDTKKPKTKDESKVDDMGDEPINLDDIPF